MEYFETFLYYIMFPMGLVIQPCKPSKKMHIKLINPLSQEYKTKYPKQSRSKGIKKNKTKKSLKTPL
jgi:hypothetical protein